MQYYRIGESQFYWDSEDYDFVMDNMMSKFLIEGSKIDPTLPMVCYHGIATEFDYIKDENMLYRDGLYELYDTKQGKALIYHWARKRFDYGFFASEMEKEDDIQIMLHPGLSEEIPLNATRFFSTVGLHSHLLRQQFAVLHASYIEWNGQAILFAAPSQTGKSTQARLWEIQNGARIINEDRVLIGKKDGVWRAYGYPCSGSSPICLNESYPLRGIVLLQQGEENTISQLSILEKIHKLTAGMEVYRWSEKEIDLALGIATQLAIETQVVQLSCTPDQEAVQVLEQYWKGV